MVGIDLQYDLSEAEDEESISDLEPSERVLSRPVRVEQFQNWSDFFFMLDILSSNFSMCDVLLFVGNIDDQIAGSDLF